MQNERRKSNIGYLFEIASEKRTAWTISLLGSVIGILCEVIPFASVYFIVRHVLEGYASANQLDKGIFLFWGVFALVAIALGVLCTLVGGYGAHRSAYKLLYGIRGRLTSYLGTLPLGYFQTTGTGDIQKMMNGGMGKIENLMAHTIPNLIGAAPLFISMLVTMFILNPWLAGGVLVPIIIAFVIQAIAFSGQKNKQRMMEMSTKAGRMNNRFNEFLRGIAVVKIFGQDQSGVREVTDSVTDYRDFFLLFCKRVSIPFSLFKVAILSTTTFVMPVAAALIAIYGGESRLVLTILMFLIVTPCLYSPIMELMQLQPNILEAAVAIDEIESVLNTAPLQEPEKEQTPGGYDIAFDNVSFSYQKADDPLRRWALADVSFQVPKGSVTALVGPSGGGKSTAGQLIPRFWDVMRGAIRIGGVDVRDMSTSTLMDSVAFVFQDTFLFSGTGRDNIAMNRPVDVKAVEQAAIAARCHEFIEQLPDGYETRLGDGGHHLSGGEAQRIAIARAIIKDSPIVVLDEATAFTDADNEALIQDALSNLLRGKTVIIIAHRLATIRGADQIVVLAQGKIAERGTHDDLMNQGGLYQRLWQLQNEAKNWTMNASEMEAVRG